jgi:hypothetical protein
LDGSEFVHPSDPGPSAGWEPMGVKKETTGSFQALDPSSSEYKKQKKNR